MYCRSLMPLSNEVLWGLERPQLKIIAALFKDHGHEMNVWTRDQLIPFIQGRQHEVTNYRPIQILKGVWVPELAAFLLHAVLFRIVFLQVQGLQIVGICS